MHKKTISPLPVLSHRVAAGQGNTGKADLWTGKIQNESTVSVSILLPQSACPETAAWFHTLRDAFLRFLQKKSAEKVGFVRFGGLKFTKTEGEFQLYAAFCPFTERVFLPVAKFTLDEKGALNFLVIL